MMRTALSDVTLGGSERGAQVAGRVAVVGFARTGRAVAALLVRRSADVVVIDDRPGPEARGFADELGVELIVSPSDQELAEVVRTVSLVVVSPGVPPTHPVFRLARNKVISEIELAWRLSQIPIVAITGTNGKTTVTALATSMLVESGVAAKAVGNIGDAFITVADDPAVEMAVCEVSSFQLAYTDRFRPVVATWLNLAEDHLDWHRDLDDYIAAKAKIWANQKTDDVIIANADDPIVLREAKRGRGRLVTFGRELADYWIERDRFMGPTGEDFGSIEELPRRFPHDEMNALAALATAHQAGATIAACTTALHRPLPMPHRVELVAAAAGVSYYDDSKATTPSAVVAALAGFSSVVLIAGGRNKGLDLGAIEAEARARKSTRIAGVVAIGEAADEVVAAFRGYPVTTAASMELAVASAAAFASEGDAVLLSPGCASFDWYRSYEERGEDFARVVHARIAEQERES
jgi:UDP-N-acetylmuramoylalanine--D-glutamate ligase